MGYSTGNAGNFAKAPVEYLSCARRRPQGHHAATPVASGKTH